ncbi:4-alpha-glucanotransferase [Gilvimarinus sp. SDUM040013]|uniref:4-alpha-glucanotransferase n=1 Tax=Gilvimarinus gilvus TaxID=3058038 RepID=A0ABU4S0C8_9GAMM|nr:4-alpha-glucanotransferase [Gilvimarinus sp. SDUM040013]MDO3385598.1 4-alpha-glucanotransferase [Gilvimarinus sp. SDUM040013]MDX6849932.1 4-alpha-glucanotransferase [Gilvimarinus sp. SDUM040013]
MESKTSKPANVFKRRTAGCLLHPTSLPAEKIGNLEPPCGNIGVGAQRYLNFLSKADLKVWQMLPTGPTHDDGSPYQSWSAHAGSPKLICLKTLCLWGWLDEDSLIHSASVTAGKLCEENLAQLREVACTQFFDFINTSQGKSVKKDFEAFLQAEASWLEDYSLFLAIRKSQCGRCWLDWPTPLRLREPAALDNVRAQHTASLRQAQFEQFAFSSQWKALHQASQDNDVLLFGDIPIFVALDSVDVWANPDQFMLDTEGKPVSVAGVPPDYFSETGQHWGNPHYQWSAMEDDGFVWWKQRLERQLDQYDLIRIDHFRGLEAYWSIPEGSVDARSGEWVEAPGEKLLESFVEHFHSLPIVAENLGLITENVEFLRKKFSLPGMLVLQFGLDGQLQNINAPHYHEPMNIVYTGTHDNDTSRGWLEQLSPQQSSFVQEYLNHPDVTSWDLIKTALSSVARMAIIPMQDWLDLDNSARMNTPGTVEKNWLWQFSWTDVPDDLCEKVRQEVHLYDRLGRDLPFAGVDSDVV